MERLQNRDTIFSQALDQGYCLLHSGALNVDNNICLFPAASGAGKSTLLTGASLSGYSVSDEYLLMKVHNGQVVFQIHGMPFFLNADSASSLNIPIEHTSDKTCYPPRNPLIFEGPASGVFFLGEPLQSLSQTDVESSLSPSGHSSAGYRGENCVFSPVSSGSGATLLMKSVVRYLGSTDTRHVELRRQAFACINSIVERLPLYEVRVSWNKNPVDTASELVKGIRKVL